MPAADAMNKCAIQCITSQTQNSHLSLTLLDFASNTFASCTICSGAMDTAVLIVIRRQLLEAIEGKGGQTLLLGVEHLILHTFGT